MINEARNTSMFILNKENNGYVSPEAWNDLARMAQLERLEELSEEYIREMVKMNRRLSGSGYGDAPRRLKEALDKLMVYDTFLVWKSTPEHFELPSNALGNLEDPSAPPGAEDYNTDEDWDWYKIVHIDYNDDADVDRIEHRDLIKLNKSKLMAPSESFPVYTLAGDTIKVYPSTIQSSVKMDYIRYPKDPKWTWTTLTDGEPVFDQGALDYQDFELPISELPKLIVKICALAGVQIRESEVVQTMNNREIAEKQLSQ